MNQNRPPEIDTDKIKKVVIPIILLIITIVFVIKSSITIKAGEAGVLFQTFGGGVKTDKTYDEGFHIIAPWNKMVVYPTRQQEVLETMGVLSSNGLDITVEVSTWFQLEQASIPSLHKEKGRGYLENIVKPAIRSATRSVIGRYTPEEIYSSKRDVIQSEIFEETQNILTKQYVQTNEVLVRDITLPPTIKGAIENKLKQEQESLEYEFKLQKEQKEAQRIKIAAEGKAEANRILNASLTTNILREKGIEATLELSKSPNSKVVVIGNQDGMPLILGNE
ncbi:MAG: prohibitin family protein [Flavobacteriales bacterium]|jgi:regulator of protease activity HflC (stomatin/prohibitin superfamily)|nr:prohibitin family protein [Flavobacteriales bacterium]